jgi:NAD(P)-dependent dehydrogenase (short-subunit alcohol dehydrogenase family)
VGIERCFEEVGRRHGPTGILMNNAGIAAVHPFLDHPLEAWYQVMGVNVTGAFLCAQAAGRQMAREGWGRIVNVASISAACGRASTGRPTARPRPP